MKLNNRGVTLIEIIVSISLISIVLVFLFRLLIVVKEMDDKSLSQLEYEEKTSLVMSKVQEQIKDQTECTFNKKSSTQLAIQCPDFGETSGSANELKLTFDNINRQITYDLNSARTVWKFPKDTQIGEINGSSSVIDGNNFYKYTIDITDDKDNNYPIEIVYLDK